MQPERIEEQDTFAIALNLLVFQTDTATSTGKVGLCKDNSGSYFIPERFISKKNDHRTYIKEMINHYIDMNRLKLYNLCVAAFEDSPNRYPGDYMHHCSIVYRIDITKEIEVKDNLHMLDSESVQQLYDNKRIAKDHAKLISMALSNG